jgi:tRNA A-37 threonylcarbamoyl transferase component Bud32
VLHGVGSSWLVFDRKLEDALVQLRLADPAVRARLFARGPRRGRGTTPIVPLRPNETLVLRRYRHGGLLGRLARSLFLGPRRALTELRVTARAEAAGAPVPHVLCLAVWPRVGPLWSAVIGTREETGAEDLLQALERRTGAADRLQLARAAGAAMRRLHDAGVHHGDLQIRNVLVRPRVPGEEPSIVLVDLDGARFYRGGGLAPTLRAKDLGRFVRSVVKTGAWPAIVGRRELAAMLGGYTAGDRTLRRELRAFATREHVRLTLHRAGYTLTGTRRS